MDKKTKAVSVKQIARLITFRGLGVCLQILMQFALARVAGPAGIGLMQLYQTWTCVLGETAAIGLPTQTMKDISQDKDGSMTLLRLKKSLQWVFCGWLALASLVVLSSFIAPNWINFSLGNQLALCWSIFCFAMLRISAEALKALNHSGEGVFAENSIFPFLMVIFCLILGFAGIESMMPQSIVQEPPAFTMGEVLIYAASLFLTIAAAFSLSRSIFLAKKKIRIDVSGEQNQIANPGLQYPLLNGETRFFWGTAILGIAFLNLPFLIMPWFGSAEEIGLFALAFKCMNPISTILIMLGAIFGPKFAQACGSRKLRTLLVQSQLVSICLYLPILLPILLFAEPILAIFGDEFRSAKNHLFILAAAQLVNALTGLSGGMLNMAGLEKREFQGSLIFCVVASVSGIWAGSVYGLAGVAIAYSASLAGKNLWSYFFAVAITRDAVAITRDINKPCIKPVIA